MLQRLDGEAKKSDIGEQSFDLWYTGKGSISEISEATDAVDSSSENSDPLALRPAFKSSNSNVSSSFVIS